LLAPLKLEHNTKTDVFNYYLRSETILVSFEMIKLRSVQKDSHSSSPCAFGDLGEKFTVIKPPKALFSTAKDACASSTSHRKGSLCKTPSKYQIVFSKLPDL
jgi:hypothetical protein